MSDDRPFASIQRHSPTELKDLARQVIQRQVWITSDAREIENGFMLLLMGLQFTEAEAQKLGALVGYMDSVLPRGINGVPMFTRAQFLHVNDMPYLFKHLQRMEAALA